jgi:hypothetical protein
MSAIQIFIYLQILDCLTTFVGFRFGASEASPFIASLMHLSSPVSGVMTSKLVALTIGGTCFFTNRSRVVSWINYWYAGLVVWNLLVILSASNHGPKI